MGLTRLRSAAGDRSEGEADREERTRGEKGYTTWQASIRIEDKEKLRRWAREDNTRATVTISVALFAFYTKMSFVCAALCMRRAFYTRRGTKNFCGE